MTSSGIIGAALGCGLALLCIIGFIIFRSRKHRKRLADDQDDEPLPVNASWTYGEHSVDSAKSSRNALTPTFVQPDVRSSTSSGNFDSLSKSQTLYPINAQRKLSSSTGYSSNSNEAFLDVGTYSINLHYRIYYDLDNSQLILHILDADFRIASTSSLDDHAATSSWGRPHKETYITFYLVSYANERRCGQTKIATLSNWAKADYDEIFALPANYEALTEHRLHFDLLCYTAYSKPHLMGSADVTLETSKLDNQDLYAELNVASTSPVIDNEIRREYISGPRPEVLVYLTFNIPQNNLQVDILKAKNLAGLFPIHNNEDTGLFAEIYIKTCLMVEELKLKRRTKTVFFSKSTNSTLIFNDSLSHQITYPQLDGCVLLLYFCIPRGDTKDYKECTVGKCVLGPLGGSSHAGHLQWHQQGNAQIIRSSAAWSPVLRYPARKGLETR